MIKAMAWNFRGLGSFSHARDERFSVFRLCDSTLGRKPTTEIQHDVKGKKAVTTATTFVFRRTQRYKSPKSSPCGIHIRDNNRHTKVNTLKISLSTNTSHQSKVKVTGLSAGKNLQVSH